MITVKGLSLRVGAFCLKDVSLAVPSGGYGVLMGPTGCGKTTLLEAIAGLRPIEGGTISMDGRDVTREPPPARGIGYVPQDAALFSTQTVREHLAFALVVRRQPKVLIDQRVQALAGWLGLDALLDRRPRGLSGGERQRVALGRALAFGPSILLLDEPLSAVDEETREAMYALLRRVRRETEVTVLHVTHNPREAQEMADLSYHFKAGKISEKPVVSA